MPMPGDGDHGREVQRRELELHTGLVCGARAATMLVALGAGQVSRKNASISLPQIRSGSQVYHLPA